MRLKKAQLEVLGLTMIVLLMSIGILFVIKFVFMAEVNSPRDSFTQKQIAQNFLAAMAQTSTDCQGASVSDLLEDCGRSSPDILCTTPVDTYSSCEHAGYVIDVLLNYTLDDWGVTYYLEAEDPNGYNILDNATTGHNLWYKAGDPDPSGGDPPSGGTKQVKSHPISLYPEPGVILVKLELFPR